MCVSEKEVPAYIHAMQLKSMCCASNTALYNSQFSIEALCYKAASPPK
jgi:hypothetical protein